MRSTQTDKEILSAIKETKIISKIISYGSTCLACFNLNPFVIERHHVGGRKHSSVTLPLCANCHVLASRNQLSYGQKWLNSKISEPERLGYVIEDLNFLIKRIRELQNE